MHGDKAALLPSAPVYTLRAGSRHWPVMRLASFIAPEALAFCRRLDRTQPEAEERLRACERRWQELCALGVDAMALPMLVLDEDAEPAILLPLARIRSADGLVEIAPMPLEKREDKDEIEAEDGGASVPHATPLCRPHLNLTRQEAGAIMRALMARMPPADLIRIALCPLAGQGNLAQPPPPRALSWRGMMHLLCRWMRQKDRVTAHP